MRFISIPGIRVKSILRQSRMLSEESAEGAETGEAGRTDFDLADDGRPRTTPTQVIIAEE